MKSGLLFALARLSLSGFIIKDCVDLERRAIFYFTGCIARSARWGEFSKTFGEKRSIASSTNFERLIKCKSVSCLVVPQKPGKSTFYMELVEESK